ncbi:hypothetical protein [Microbacterium flavescens]|uniref:hypothetical protein n=1 Tax=Microbacterium flavescens TaxID=69366 RepID=UPI001BDEA449|nr:hypothetical protein [Microbacterium flavescens]
MPASRTSARLAALALVAAAAVAVPGCAVVDELVYKQRSSSFDALADAPDASVAHAAWVPADATDIQIVESTNADAGNATLLLTSSAPLDPDLCVEVDRQSAPSYAIDGAPEIYGENGAATVFACGAWSVVASDDGWFGWTPNHPDEHARSPAAP